MASAFTHAVVGLGASQAYTGKKMSKAFWFWTILCPVLPDADVIGFRFGVHYEDFLGHRGFSHSLLFAFLLALGVVMFFFYAETLLSKIKLLFYFFLITASHSVLDAMTTGGLGVAFFSPWDQTRYFFPWRPIRVSPFSISRFFSIRGVLILKSEIIWVWLPTLLVSIGLRKLVNRKLLKTI